MAALLSETYSELEVFYSSLNELPWERAPALQKAEYIWVCSEHHFSLATLASRLKGSTTGSDFPCAYCLRRLRCYSNSLATEAPFLLESLSGLAPLQSDQAVAPVCPLGHVSHYSSIRLLLRRYRALLKQPEPTTFQKLCLVCLGLQLEIGFNDLATLAPALAAQWSAANKLTPDQVLLRKSDSHLWVCPRGHQWEATIGVRLKGHGCRRCGRMRLNSLTAEEKIELNASYAAEFSVRLNGGLTVDDFHPRSHTSVWWECSKSECNGFWLASPKERQRDFKRCPSCFPAGSELQKAIQEAIQKLLDNHGLHKEITVNDRKTLDGAELDLHLPKLKKAVEVNGCYWHSEELIQKRNGMSSKEYHLRKLSGAAAVGVGLIFIWECSWSKNRTQVIKQLEGWLQGQEPHPNLLKLQEIGEHSYD